MGVLSAWSVERQAPSLFFQGTQSVIMEDRCGVRSESVCCADTHWIGRKKSSENSFGRG